MGVGSDNFSLPAEFKLNIERRGDALHMAIDGELDLASVPVLTSHLREAEAGDASLIVLDLAGMSFIDSMGLRALLEAYARSGQNGDRLRITPGPPQAQRLFKLAGLLDKLPFVPPERDPAA